MTCNYSVTFEYELRPPQTHRGTVSGGKTWTLVQRATKEAQKALKPVGWSSCLCVLLDRAEQSDLEGGRVILDEGEDVDSEDSEDV